MLEPRRILAPCDLSDASRPALERAVALAGWYHAELVVLRAVPLWATTWGYPPFMEPLADVPRSRDELLQELKAFASPSLDPRVTTRFVLEEGDAVDEILGAAAELSADLIVMGTHGRRGFERWAIGSVAEAVLRKAPCPVLTVRVGGPRPAPPSRPPFERILCAVDLARPSLEALRYSLALAEEADARLTLLHVLELPPDQALRRAGFDAPAYRRELAEDARECLQNAVPAAAREWCRVETIIAAGDAHEEILQAARSTDAHLIVLGVHGASALQLLLFGSTARRVVRDAPCPVLTVRFGPKIVETGTYAHARDEAELVLTS
jgi:nucleotide-binding universal stress UspA family protein